MTDLDRLLSQFIDEWNAGQLPSVRGYLELVDDERDRSQLAGQITAFLDVAPIPAYPPSTLDDARVGSVANAAASAFEAKSSGWPALLPRWRAAAGLTLEQLADRVLEGAGLRGADRQKAAGYLTSMERGGLDAGVMSGRAMTVVARALGVNAGDLIKAGQPSHAMAVGPVFRAVDEDVTDEVVDKLTGLADALLSPGEPDPIDEFFLGAD
ncbi:MAG: hypothetical protein ACR2ND_00040 [Solirubrobacteraceae bacterium]